MRSATLPAMLGSFTGLKEHMKQLPQREACGISSAEELARQAFEAAD